MPRQQNGEVQRHTFAVLVENQFGVLGRITGLFSARGFNIESLSVAETEDPSVSRITLVTTGDDMILEQVNKQLNRLIDVIKVTDLSEESHVDRGNGAHQGQYGGFQARRGVPHRPRFSGRKIVDVTTKTYVLEVTGDEGKICAVIDLLKPLGIKEMVRTGKNRHWPRPGRNVAPAEAPYGRNGSYDDLPARLPLASEGLAIHPTAGCGNGGKPAAGLGTGRWDWCCADGGRVVLLPRSGTGHPADAWRCRFAGGRTRT